MDTIFKYDGETFELEIEYRPTDSSFDHAFGCEVRTHNTPVSFKIYSNGAAFTPTDADFKREMWSFADLAVNETIYA